MSETPTNQFQQRRALDLAIEALEKTSSEAELVQGAYAIADEFATSLALAALLKRLDTPSSQLRGGLARLATFLPAEETLKALQEYALNRANPAQGRVTAAMIVERFLGAALRPGTLSDLQGNEDAAVQSLHDAVSEGEEEIAVLVDYVTQMQEYDPNIAMQVMHHLDALAPQLRTNLLRLIALDRRVQVARAALARLEALAQAGDPAFPQGANAEGMARARRALYVLAPNLPPDLAKESETALRKLQFRGMGYEPARDGLRCFLGLPRSTSDFDIEFWEIAETPSSDRHLTVSAMQGEGIVAIAFEQKPAPKIYRIAEGIGNTAQTSHARSTRWHVEIPAATGRDLLERMMRTMITRKLPLPAKYLASLEWLWDAPRQPVDPAVLHFLEGAGAPLDRESGDSVASTLLGLAGMESWSLSIRVDIGVRTVDFHGFSSKYAAKQFVKLAKEQGVERAIAERFEAALRLLALWLHYAGDEQNAANARNLATSQGVWTLEENPLIPALFAMK